MTTPVITSPESVADYRDQLLAEGAPDALRSVPSGPGGLLAELPEAPPGLTGWPWTMESPVQETRPDLPELFVVMPSFRQGRYLEAAIRSVLLQNYPRLRFVVMDARSDDESPRILERYRPWISHVRIGPDRGQSHAINLGFALAPPSGLRCWLNSDDLYLPGAFASVAALHAGSGADFIHGDGLALEQASGRLRYEPGGFLHPRLLSYPGIILSHSAFWHARIHAPLWEDLHCALDYELWLRLVPRARRRRYLPRTLGLIREHAEAKSSSPAQHERWVADRRLNELAHPERYRPSPARDWLHRIIQRLHRTRRRHPGFDQAAAMCRTCGWAPPVNPPPP